MPTQAPNAELTRLLLTLNDQRGHILGAIDGLDEDDLRRSVLPSGWTCLGLVQHLTLDVERFWFSGIIAGSQAVLDELNAIPNAWIVDPSTSASDILDGYRRQIAHTESTLEGRSLDDGPTLWPAGLFGDWQPESIRQIVLHVITETAAHAGHLDIVRELIDQRQWLVLTD